MLGKRGHVACETACMKAPADDAFSRGSPNPNAVFGMAHQIEYATREEMVQVVNQAVATASPDSSQWAMDQLEWAEESPAYEGAAHEQSQMQQLFSASNCDVFQVGMQPDDDWPDDCQVQATSNGATDAGRNGICSEI